MRKVIGAIAGLVFGLFGIGVIGLMISLTYGAMQRIFPGDFQNQMWGLVIFDIATLAWGLAFIFKSNSVGQYAAAGAGFLVGLIGTIGMIAAEVTLSGQSLTGGTADQAQIGQWMIYAFIACTAIHVILTYTHHGAAPEIAQQIGTGVARGLIRDKAIKDAEAQLETERAALAQAITADIVASVRRDLQLPIPIDGTPFDRRQAPRTFELPYPIEEDNSPISDDLKRSYAPGTMFRDGTTTPKDLNDPFWSEHPHHMTERWGNQEAGNNTPSPFPGQPPE